MKKNKIEALQDKIKLAEEAISKMSPDSPLTEKAFELILSNLLQNKDNTYPSVQKPLAKKRGVVTKRKTNLPPAQKQETRLKFDPTNLETLKEFYDKHKPSGRELSLFILTNFLRTKQNMETFREEDVAYCYQQLLNLRTVSRPPAMNSGQIRQTISWLVSPSRNKQWLETSGKGEYQVSAVGKLKFVEMETEYDNQETTVEEKV